MDMYIVQVMDLIYRASLMVPATQAVVATLPSNFSTIVQTVPCSILALYL